MRQKGAVVHRQPAFGQAGAQQRDKVAKRARRLLWRQAGEPLAEADQPIQAQLEGLGMDRLAQARDLGQCVGRLRAEKRQRQVQVRQRYGAPVQALLVAPAADGLCLVGRAGQGRAKNSRSGSFMLPPLRGGRGRG